MSSTGESYYRYFPRMDIHRTVQTAATITEPDVVQTAATIIGLTCECGMTLSELAWTETVDAATTSRSL